MALSGSSILCLFFCGILIVSAGCTRPAAPAPATTPVMSPAASVVSADATTGQPRYISNETLVAFVQEAAAYAKTQGRERALAEFSNPNGSFVRGELYIYAYDFNGTTLAHPVNPEKIGKTRDDEGAVGVFVREMGASVRNGTGWYRFTYVNPARNRTLESKLGYGMMIDDTWWLGSGVYKGPVNVSATTAGTGT